ncbi:hypothetical protein ANN_24474 [Periplaneta americana]|uniref:HAT C-terminal dimerisation domain-containing protein n=1 Tax=Periplaneta americana TaxID=6978 RepID=A0ABQ8S3H2_PERAM|nr:hypothetical protein ANN_24474 [Periplaneta americana]
MYNTAFISAFETKEIVVAIDMGHPVAMQCCFAYSGIDFVLTQHCYLTPALIYPINSWLSCLMNDALLVLLVRFKPVFVKLTKQQQTSVLLDEYMKCWISTLDNPVSNSEQLTALVQAPLTSCDVERSFSRYKAMLRGNRRRMTTENIRHCLVVKCNNIHEHSAMRQALQNPCTKHEGELSQSEYVTSTEKQARSTVVITDEIKGKVFAFSGKKGARPKKVAAIIQARFKYSVSWKAGGKGPLGRLRRRWEDNIKMNLKEMGYDDRDWINVAQDRDRWRAYDTGIQRSTAAVTKAGVVITSCNHRHSNGYEEFSAHCCVFHSRIEGKQWRYHVALQTLTLQAVRGGFVKNEKENFFVVLSDKCDNAGEMSPGSSTESHPAFARIGLRENPGKNLNQVTCPDRDSNLGHLVSQPDALTVTPQVEGKLREKPQLNNLSQPRFGPGPVCFTFKHANRYSIAVNLCAYCKRKRTNINVVVITEDVQNVLLLLEYRPHIDVSLTCEHDPKLQEYCVCPQNMTQFDSEGIPNQAPETNKPMIFNGPTSRNREGSDQVSVEAKQLGKPLPIHRSGNLRSKYRRAVRLKCAGAPSCKK